MKQILLVLLLIALVGAGYFGFSYYRSQEDLKNISSYETCVEAGFPSLESYPPRCITDDGRSFTQEIGNILEYHEEFLLENPRPNQKIASPIRVSGQARGIWFFEGSFSGELFDRNNTSLGTVILQADGEWMTEEFVPFEGELSYTTPGTETGTLVIMNANPSGLPEHEKKINIPVMF